MKESAALEVMAIVHGQSEYRICSNIKSNLRIKHEIIARNNGKISIQVTSVMDILNDRRFKSLKNFTHEFDVVRIKGKLMNFSLYIIMDVDDCTPAQKNMFISKEMFKGHWMHEYITPIYNDPNLEATMKAAKIEVQHKKDYLHIFPTNHGDLDLAKARELRAKLVHCERSNIYKYIDHCIAVAEKTRLVSR